MKLDKEATARMIKNALGNEQLQEDERKRHEQNKRNMLSDSEDEDDDATRKGRKINTEKSSNVKKLGQSKPIQKFAKKEGTASRKEMHGATIVPQAAHLKYKKLLEKK